MNKTLAATALAAALGLAPLAANAHHEFRDRDYWGHHHGHVDHYRHHHHRHYDREWRGSWPAPVAVYPAPRVLHAPVYAPPVYVPPVVSVPLPHLSVRIGF